MAIVLIGTLDTKGRELAFVREILHQQGHNTLVIDAGSQGEPFFRPDIDREIVFTKAGKNAEEVQRRGDRGEAVGEAAKGVATLVSELHEKGLVQGILSLGGSAGTTIGTSAMRVLPFGLPKVMVSTLASGQTRPYVGSSDILMMYSVADIAGLNRLTRTVLTNAANAMAGMVTGQKETVSPSTRDRPVVAATMFGVTTKCVEQARLILEEAGCEVLVFHATGTGGQAMETLIRDGQIDAVLDLTTTELADELVGGVLSAGAGRLEAAGRKGIPQVVSLGALDMVNFGPRETVPEKFATRRFHVHNPTVTLMRTTPEENARLGRWIAEKLSKATGPTTALIPRGGVSAIDAPGQPFHDPEADAALFAALTEGLGSQPSVRLVVREDHINDPAFARLAAQTLMEMMGMAVPVESGSVNETGVL